jgi:hypothetical protein
MAEILAAELRADAEVLGELVDLRLERHVAEGVPALLPSGRERVEPARRGQLHGLQRRLRAGAADDDRQVVGRAGGGAERLDLVFQELQQLLARQHRARLLERKVLFALPPPLRTNIR